MRKLAPTDKLLQNIVPQAALDVRVGEWLKRMAADWDRTVPSDPQLTGPLLYDVVPALSGSEVQAA